MHHSRVVKFPGRDLPYIERLIENHWGASELEHIFSELKKWDNTNFNIATMIFRANLLVYKKAGFEQMSIVPDHVRQQMLTEMDILSATMNNQGMQILCVEDQMHNLTNTAFSGLSQVMELFMLDIAGAAEIPVTKLFMRSPSGMNATGDSDMQIYYDSIAEKQESVLRPIYDKLLPILCMSALGAIPDDLEYTFENIQTPTEAEKMGFATQITTAITGAYTSGVISQRTALQELSAHAGITDMWHSITDEDIEAADDIAAPPDEMDGGFGGFGDMPSEGSEMDENEDLSKNDLDHRG